jgi:hypothetical protein
MTLPEEHLAEWRTTNTLQRARACEESAERVTAAAAAP